MKRTRIAPRSKKRQAEYQERRLVLGQIIHERDLRCEFPGCKQMADDAHEVLSRAAGGSITDTANIRILCRPHHTFVTDNTREAIRLGLSRSRYTP